MSRAPLVSNRYKVAGGMTDITGMCEADFSLMALQIAANNPCGIIADIMTPEYIMKHGSLEVDSTMYGTAMTIWSVWIRITDPAHISILKLSEC